VAAVSEAPALFLRKATGLVKGWSRRDAFIYSFMSVNLITLGLYYGLSVLAFVPNGQVLPAVIISGVLVTFLVITYAGLISAMPRAGGDYVWQSRVLGGGIAFVLAVTGWWFILWHWAPIYANILSVEVLQPIFAILKWNGAVSWLATKNGIFITSIGTIVLAGFLVSLGMEGYAKVQRICFYIGMAALLVMLAILLFGSKGGFQSAFNHESANLFGAKGDVYGQTLKVASTGNGVPAMKLSLTPFFGASLLLVPLLAFWILWPNWGATLYGEVRGASDFKRVMSGMMWGLWVTVIGAVLLLLLMAKTFGWQFFNAANANYWFPLYGGTAAPTIPVFPYPPLLASFFIHNAAFQALFVLAFGAWFLGWAGTLFLSSTRVVFAAAFDRILPEWAARVSERRHVPFGALALMLFPSVVVSAFYAYKSGFVTYTLDATLVIAVTFFGTAIAAMILPWRKKSLYQNSAIAKYKIAGVPMITVASAVTAGFLGWMLFKWFTDDLYAINNKTSLKYLGVLYGLAIVVYAVAYVVRRRQGINLKAIHEEIPVD
jgi:basic amino acid/polyamine antiporter, APA family